jgi:hypothetical protein
VDRWLERYRRLHAKLSARLDQQPAIDTGAIGGFMSARFQSARGFPSMNTYGVTGIVPRRTVPISTLCSFMRTGGFFFQRAIRFLSWQNR